MPYHCGMEKLKLLCQGGNPSISDLAKALGVSVPTVSEWCHGRRPVPIRWCIAIENATDGCVTRRDLRPDDWQHIWPELAQAPVSVEQPATETVAN